MKDKKQSRFTLLSLSLTPSLSFSLPLSLSLSQRDHKNAIGPGSLPFNSILVLTGSCFSHLKNSLCMFLVKTALDYFKTFLLFHTHTLMRAHSHTHALSLSLSLSLSISLSLSHSHTHLHALFSSRQTSSSFVLSFEIQFKVTLQAGDLIKKDLVQDSKNTEMQQKDF